MGAYLHIGIDQHLARMERFSATNMPLDRLPNLRLDPAAPAPVDDCGFMVRDAPAVGWRRTGKSTFQPVRSMPGQFVPRVD